MSRSTRKAAKAVKNSSGNGGQDVFFRGGGISPAAKNVSMVFARDFRTSFGPDAQAFLRLHRVSLDHVLMVESVSSGLFAVHI